MNLSSKCSKIRELNKEKAAFNWTPDHEVEFQELKAELLSAKGVMAYDPRKNIEIFTDAAKKGGMGYALCQTNEERDL